MKQAIKILFSVVLIATFAQSSKAQGKPVLQFDSLNYDFGYIYEGDSAVHYFVFKNVGNAPLIIDEVKTTCSCTASDWPKYPIQPGASGSIRVEFDTHDKPEGSYAKGINMYSNAGETNFIIDIKILKRE